MNSEVLMAELSKKARGWAVVSAIYFLIVCFWVAVISGSRFNAEEFMLVLVVGGVPLLIGWGIWWAKKGSD